MEWWKPWNPIPPIPRFHAGGWPELWRIPTGGTPEGSGASGNLPEGTTSKVKMTCPINSSREYGEKSLPSDIKWEVAG